MPSETEAGSAGEQPAKGYLGEAQQNERMGAVHKHNAHPDPPRSGRPPYASQNPSRTHLQYQPTLQFTLNQYTWGDEPMPELNGTRRLDSPE